MHQTEIGYRLGLPDIILMIGVLFGSFWFLLAVGNASTDSQAKLVIYQDGQVVQEIEINHKEMINLKVISGQMNIEIDPVQGVRVVNADCPAHICTHAGLIKQAGETIICLPNKVLLELKGSRNEYNAISY